MSEFPAAGRLAGIDYGHVRIGVAVSDPHRTLASPYANYTRRGEQGDARFFRTLVSDEQIVGFVVGLPLHTSGHESEKSREVRRFADWLTLVTGRPVRFYDERFTTREANDLLEHAQLTKKKRRQRLDKVAAQLLLAAFLESDGCGTEPAALDDAEHQSSRDAQGGAARESGKGP
ncbi:MAG: Holliday junction resolvase RuvX [Planctomycetaceae bacterium]|nr:Holliday junction resolvase RuvX [Planctomycetaceae bacterium]